MAACIACAAGTVPALARPLNVGVTAPGDTVSVVVEMTAPSALALLAQLPPADQVAAAQVAALTQAQVAAVDQAQQALLAELAALDVQPLYRVQRVYNGIAVRVDRNRLDAVRSLPGVKAVHPLIPKLPSNHVSVPAIGAPALWGGLPGVTGRGVTIAVIDTGVDYLHAGLGGPGMGYAGNDPARVGDVPGFPNPKVVAGYDFVGDDYNADAGASTYQPVPQPDPDPMDCYGFGHGTHVAGTAAGYGVQLDGARYPGPYDAATPGRAFQVGPGVAPEANVVALKVFGCYGSSEIVDLAIEWAVDPDGDGDFSDHVDVINLSLGSPLGSLDDLTTVAADNAARLGVVVVASAGNSGDTHYVVSSPGVADRVISVAAVGPVLPPQLASFSSRGPRRGDSGPKPDLAAPGDGIVSTAAGGGSYTASGTSMAAPHVAGAMALLRQLHPAASTVLAQGAVAPAAAGWPWTVEELKALAMNTALYPVTATVSSGVAPVSPARAGAGRVDLAAAAQARVIAYNADAPGLVGVGFGALEVLDRLSAVRNVRVANKSAMTATYSARYVPAVDLAGVTIQVASSPTLTVPPGGVATLALMLTATAAEMDHGRDPTLATDQWWTPRAWLSEEAGYLELTPVVEDAAAQGAAAGHLPLHVPVYAAPRPASAQVAGGDLDFGEADTGRALVEFSGHSLTGSTSPTSVVSLASLFELSHVSGVEAGREPADGRAQPCLCADLQYVGVTVVQPAAGSADPLLAFGVATHSPWDSPHAVRFDILIDTDLDGSADYRLYNGDASHGVGRRTFSDAFLALLERWPSRSPVTQEYLNGVAPTAVDVGLFNTRLMMLPVRASALGLGEEVTRFGYVVASYDLDDDAGAGGTLVERTPMRQYDLQRPGLRIAAGLDGSALHRVDIGGSISVDFERPAYQQAGAPDLLVFHYHNLDPQRAQVVPVHFVDRRALFLPLIQR